MFADDEYFHEVSSERDEETPLWVIVKDNARATLIMFAGGHGKLKIKENGIRKLKKNFLVRTRENFAAQGFNVIVMDKPGDRNKLFGFRTSEDHAQDVAAVIKFARQEFKKPVWLVGTSRGTISVANAAARLQGHKGPDGIVLTSSVLVTSRKDSVRDVKLERIKVPSLFVHNTDDGCHVCPYGEVNDVMKLLNKVKDIELQTHSGGNSEVNNQCKALTPHGFLGLENKVIADIVGWIEPRLGKAKGLAKKNVPATNL